MMKTIFIPRDSSSLALGAVKVAQAITQTAHTQNIPIQIIRNGSYGMYWLEPMIEVSTPQGRIAYGPITPEDIPSLFAAQFLEGGDHPKKLGVTQNLTWLKKQERLTFARMGIVDPLSLSDYIAHDGYIGLNKAISFPPQKIVEQVTQSGLRGRGGAAFPTGIKWQTVHNTSADQKYIVCNADEGDSGTYSDRMIMEGDPFTLIEGMTISAIAVGATKGYIYLRSEYPHALDVLNQAIRMAYQNNYLGKNILGSPYQFDLEVRRAAGAYVCGEETSLLESLEGKRGLVRYKPPLPAIQGLFQKPTVINNVISFASVPIILDKGADFYRNYGMGKSQGTLPIQLAGNLKQCGLVEKAFGITLRELLYEYGGGSASGRPIRAVQVGGPLGSYLPESQFDIPLDYEAYSQVGAVVGHGGIVAFDDTVNMAEMARYAFEFCAIESCGKCTPCRIGSTRGVEIMDKLIQDKKDGKNTQHHIHLLKDLNDTLLNGSLCALGGMTPYPVNSALQHFSEDFS